MQERNRTDLSVVVPVFNEQDNVAPLYEELRRVLEVLGESFEILFVDDGSTDDTAKRLHALASSDPRLRVVDLDGNFGEAAALSAGFHAARGDIVVTLDGDGQNDPADIPRLLDALRSGDLQAVSGRRDERRESFWLRILPSRIANALIARLTGVPVHDCGCGLKAYRREFVRSVHLPRGMNRFLPAVLGVKPNGVAEVVTRDRRRHSGRSHYGLARTFAVLRDLPALPFLARDPRRAEVGLALATAAAAGCGALFWETSRLTTAAIDAVAVLCGLGWWNVRRFNRAQENGVYRLRESGEPADHLRRASEPRARPVAHGGRQETSA
jgi:glycosyltransferase involved in cell wall biosynthesis